MIKALFQLGKLGFVKDTTHCGGFVLREGGGYQVSLMMIVALRVEEIASDQSS